MKGQLEILHGLWAIRWETGRADFTRFPAKVDARRVLSAVKAEFKGFTIEPPEAPGWLFDELWETTPLFGGENHE